MLLFKPEHVLPILEGRKTETRRIWKKQRVKVGSIQTAKTAMFDPRYFARLKILDVKLEKLGYISDDACKREGYNSFSEFKIVWEKINKRRWDPSQEVYVILFEVV